MKNYTINELIDSLMKSKRENCEFTDVIDLFNGLNRHLYLNAIDNDVADAMDNFIRFFNREDEENNIPVEERKPIKIYVDSTGGDLMGTLTIIDAIRLSKTPVWTINAGQAYSGGFFVFITGHKRISYPNASFLFHEGSTGTMGDANKFNNWADFYKKLLNRLKDITLKYTNISKEEYEKHQKDDWWFFVEDALEMNVCDEISEELI